MLNNVLNNVPLLQQKVNKIILDEGLGRGVLSESSFLKTFRSGSEYVFGVLVGAVGFDGFFEFVDTIKVNGMSVSISEGDCDTVWVRLPEYSECPYDIYRLVTNWANTHGADVVPFGCDGDKDASFSSIYRQADLGIGLQTKDEYEEYLECRYGENGDGISGDAIFRALWDKGYRKKALGYKSCGANLFMMECGNCGYKKVVKVHCKLRCCPKCQSAKVGVWTGKYEKFVKLLSLHQNDLKMLTLTLKNVSDLRAGVDRIRVCFVKLRHRKLYKERIRGGIYGIEATVGEDGLWHVHLHALISADYIRQPKIVCDWLEITQDSFIVYIQKVPGRCYVKTDSGKWVWKWLDVRGALRYVVKYMVKGADIDGWSADKIAEFVTALDNVRMVQAFGIFLGKMDKDRIIRCPECGSCCWIVTSLDGHRLAWIEYAINKRGIDARASPCW